MYAAGFIDSDMTADLDKTAILPNIPLKRFGTPEEVAKAIIFAVENEFITGTTIDIDGGWILS